MIEVVARFYRRDMGGEIFISVKNQSINEALFYRPWQDSEWWGSILMNGIRPENEIKPSDKQVKKTIKYIFNSKELRKL